MLDAGEGDAVVFEHVEVLLGEIMADDADEIDGAAEEGGGEGGVGGGTTEEVLGFCGGGFDVVDGDGAADDDAWSGGHEWEWIVIRMRSLPRRRKGRDGWRR